MGEALELGSSDGVVKIAVPDGTSAIKQDGEPVSMMELRLVDEPPPLPPERLLVGSACDLGPDGSTFDPPLRLTLQYDESLVPSGVAEEDLTIAYFDDEAEVWIELAAKVDTAAGTVTAPVRHFTMFAVVGTVRPAAFSVGDLVVDPAEAMPGDDVVISAEVSNIGGMSGSYTVAVDIDGVLEATQSVVLAGGASRNVSFTVSRDRPGSCVVRIGDNVGGFSVTAPGGGLSGVLWAGGIVAVVAIAGLFVVLRRRGALAQQDRATGDDVTAP